MSLGVSAVCFSLMWMIANVFQWLLDARFPSRNDVCYAVPARTALYAGDLAVDLTVINTLEMREFRYSARLR